MPVKKVINHHKLQRKFNNKLKRTKKLFSSFFSSKKTRRDFAWQGREVKNPFIHEKEKDFSFIKIIIIIISLLVTFGIFIFHPFFRIVDIEITGLQRIDQADMLSTTEGILNYKKFGFLKENSYLTTNIAVIKDIIKERYPIDKIIVKKSFPNKLNIVIQEKISTVIYDNGKEYSYVDLEGKVVEVMRKVSSYEWKDITEQMVTTTESGETVTSTIVVGQWHDPDINTIKEDLGNYPIIYDKNNTTEVTLNTKVLNDEDVSNLIKWFRGLDSNENIPLKYFIFEDNKQDLTIKTYKGTYIKSRLSRPVEEQLDIISNLFKEKIKNENKYINYIDLRYSDRIYWH
ncbi:MAG: hypothetical protein COX80_02975 [Candidatus Magasanikbacteria bacterium CG_4_10_14_0_2_um_filter_33_14]|uniref:POTRA domain-containing protein n=1 Tax=Candidatus Magasanikbacteria bacterium CG_4_10_14_0_2_um_filter_33_14 TaxID=1974636 RepID=A0A2M7VAH8_9BACT|nr:MAG: hypothetical protein COX80_02975 [Candidatus Magasanikbacteria bacterium CG_4_10_14_0_2_um_filter_33_14]